MTRDQAIKAYNEAMGYEYVSKDACEAQSGRFMDALVALGLLKLEEPKTLLQRFEDAICKLPRGDRGPGTILDVLTAAGLRIVDAGEEGK